MGLGGSNHDHSACIVKDGRIAVAIEDERLVKQKRGHSHWAEKPCLAAAEYCLDAVGASIGELDAIFVNIDIDTAYPFWEDYRFEVVPHHLNHAASAYFMSTFDESALLVIDGRGGAVGDGANTQFETVSIGSAKDARLQIETFQSGVQRISSSSWRYVTENSLGWFYKTVSEAIGFGGGGEGKTMGLASYGTARFRDAFEQFCSIDQDGRFNFDPYSGFWDWLADKVSTAGNGFQVRADLAATAQSWLEDGVLAAAHAARRRSGSKRLCFAGGVALNGVANHRLRKECGFDEVFFWPPCGDNGLAIGAALYGYHSILEQPRKPLSISESESSAYCGRVYSAEEIVQATSEIAVSVSEPEDIIGSVVDCICRGEAFAVFQGGSEIGPRALGHRSIFFDPTLPDGRDRMNRIKRRESFRPFAPIVLEEDAGTYFDLVGPSPFMLDIAVVREPYRRLLPAVTHVDNTARVQTVRHDGDPFIVGLLRRLKESGRPPIVLNTSFNLSGKPIVESPADAVDAFMKLDLNTMVMDRLVLTKHSPYAIRMGGQA